MIAVTLVATNSRAHTSLDSAAVNDVIWAFATPQTGIEHVHVVSCGTRLEIVVFCLADTEDKARSESFAVCERARANSPMLRGWAIQRLSRRHSRFNLTNTRATASITTRGRQNSGRSHLGTLMITAHPYFRRPLAHAPDMSYFTLDNLGQRAGDRTERVERPAGGSRSGTCRYWEVTCLRN
jgi:hypothetical protein